MGRLEELTVRAAQIEKEAIDAEAALKEEQDIAALEAKIEERERSIAAAPCAKAWGKFVAATKDSDRIRPARIAIGAGKRYAEILFRQPSKDEVLANDGGEEGAKKLFIACVQWYPGQPETEAIDEKKFHAWIAPYLPLYPMLWAQLATALTSHASETADVYRGKA